MLNPSQIDFHVFRFGFHCVLFTPTALRHTKNVQVLLVLKYGDMMATLMDSLFWRRHCAPTRKPLPRHWIHKSCIRAYTIPFKMNNYSPPGREHAPNHSNGRDRVSRLLATTAITKIMRTTTRRAMNTIICIMFMQNASCCNMIPVIAILMAQ